MVVLAESQFEFGGQLFGRGTPVEVGDIDWGSPDIDAPDQPYPGADGTGFGRDRHGGAVLALELTTVSDDATGTLAAWDNLAAAWTDPAWREHPRLVAPLRLRAWGGRPRVVFGRPRKWAPATTKDVREGITKHVAEFKTADSTYYSDEEYTRELAMVPALGRSGIRYPIRYPLKYSPAQTSDSHRITNAGNRRSWPVITFDGPITNPALTLLASGVRIQVSTALSHTQSLTIDPRPWAQTVQRSDGAHLRASAGPLPLARLALAPGETVVQFTGQDPTGGSRCTIRWRDAYSTPGGLT